MVTAESANQKLTFYFDFTNTEIHKKVRVSFNSSTRVMAAVNKKPSSFFVSLDSHHIGKSKVTFYQKLQQIIGELEPTLAVLPGIVGLSCKSWRAQNTVVIMLSSDC